MRIGRLLFLAATAAGLAPCVATSPSLAQEQRPVAIPTFGSMELEPGKPYIVHRAHGPITIDQVPHPAQWQNAMVIRDFKVAGTRRPAQSKTEAMMLWDDWHHHEDYAALLFGD